MTTSREKDSQTSMGASDGGVQQVATLPDFSPFEPIGSKAA
jgi:hypothetical protein